MSPAVGIQLHGNGCVCLPCRMLPSPLFSISNLLLPACAAATFFCLVLAGPQQQPAQQQQQQEVALAAGLSRALCYTSRLLPRYAASTRHKAKPRILSLLAGADTPLQYIPVMNCIFAAQHAGVALDACILGAADSAFMQQAAHITGEQRGTLVIGSQHGAAGLARVFVVFRREALTRGRGAMHARCSIGCARGNTSHGVATRHCA